MTDEKNDAEGQLLIREIEEDLKREQYAKLWKTYGNWVIGAALAVVMIVAGYQGWQSWRTQQRTQDAQRYAAISAQAPAQQAEALASLAADAATGYGALASLRRASLLAETGDSDGAIAAYERLAADTGLDGVYRDLATLRLVMLQVDHGDPAALEGRLQTLLKGAWRHSAEELRAVLAQRRGDVTGARAIYQRLADDLGAPQGLRARAAQMLAVLPSAENQKG